MIGVFTSSSAKIGSTIYSGDLRTPITQQPQRVDDNQKCRSFVKDDGGSHLQPKNGRGDKAHHHAEAEPYTAHMN